MKKIYLCFSLIWLISILFLNIRQKPSQKYEKIDSMEANVLFEINNLLVKKQWTGKLFYIEPNNLYLYLKDNKNGYIEIGSNNSHFWYYSTNEDILYYGQLKDVSFLIKEIFNPYIIIKTLFLNTNKINGIEEDFLTGNYGCLLRREILIKNNKIYRQRVYEKDSVIYTVDVRRYHDSIPCFFVFNYLKEGYKVNIKLNEIKSNEKIDFIFKLPINKYKKNKFLVP